MRRGGCYTCDEFASICGANAPCVGTEAPVPSSLKGVQHRMQSVLLVSAIIAGLGVSLGLAVLFLRIAFRLLGRTPAD